MSSNPPYITGLHGCNCHPFESWEECDRANKQRFKPEQRVTERCTGKKGTIIEMADGDFRWYRVLMDPGLHQHHICVHHCSMLILDKTPHQLSMFKVNSVP